MKTYEKIINFLKDSPREWQFYQTICDHIFHGDETKFYEAVAYLRSKDLIRTKETDQKTLNSCRMLLTPLGIAYFQQQAEEKSKSKKKNRVDYLKSLGLIFLGALLGEVLPRFFTWVSSL